MSKIKKILKVIWNEFIYGGHLLSVGGAAITATILILFEIKINFLILLIGYFILQTIYTYNHFKELEKDEIGNPERVSHVRKLKKIMPFLISTYLVAALAISILINIQTFFFVFFLLFGGISFSVKIKKFTQKIPLLKNIYTAFFWSIGPIFLPFVFYSIPVRWTFLFFLFFIFIRLFLNTIYFDIKDIERDKKDGLKTLPVLIGKEKTIQFLHALNLVSFFPIILGVYFKVLPLSSLALIIFYFYSHYYIIKSKSSDNKKIRLFSYAVVDAEYIFWPFTLLIIKLIF